MSHIFHVLYSTDSEINIIDIFKDIFYEYVYPYHLDRHFSPNFIQNLSCLNRDILYFEYSSEDVYINVTIQYIPDDIKYDIYFSILVDGEYTLNTD